jgi:hypothetical protein
VFQCENSLVYVFRIKILHYGVCLKLNITPLCCVFQYENSLVYVFRIEVLHYVVVWLKLNNTP